MKSCHVIELKKGDEVVVYTSSGDEVNGVVRSVEQPSPSPYSKMRSEGTVHVKIGEETFSFSPSRVWRR